MVVIGLGVVVVGVGCAVGEMIPRQNRPPQPLVCHL